jgi:hypothetical protein
LILDCLLLAALGATRRVRAAFRAGRRVFAAITGAGGSSGLRAAASFITATRTAGRQENSRDRHDRQYHYSFHFIGWFSPWLVH